MDTTGNILLEYKTNYFRKGLMQLIVSFGIVFIFIFLAAGNFFKNNSFVRTIFSIFFPIEDMEETSSEFSGISNGAIPFRWMFIFWFFILVVIIILVYFVIYKLGNWYSGKKNLYFHDAHYIFTEDGLNIINKKGNYYFPYTDIQWIGEKFAKMQKIFSYLPRNRSKFILLKMQMKDKSFISIVIPPEYSDQVLYILQSKSQMINTTVA